MESGHQDDQMMLGQHWWQQFLQNQQPEPQEQQQEQNQIFGNINILDILLKSYNARQRLSERNQQQKKHLRDVYDRAQVKYYKQQFKFQKPIKHIFHTLQELDARLIFQYFLKIFQELGYDLCQIIIKTYKRNSQSKQQKYEAKLVRLQRQILNILKRDCYKEKISKQYENNYRAIPIEQKIKQCMHFTLKIKFNSPKVLQNLQKNNLNLRIIEDEKYKHKDYLNVQNNSYCNGLQSWDIGCRIRSQGKQIFYRYFQPSGEKYITFSRSMQKEDQSNIRQICIYNSFDSNIVLRTVIKKQQIYLLTFSKDKNDIFFFISSPPIYQFSFFPPNSYCLPNYLNNWQRVQNFLLLKHKAFKDNDFLRLYLYSNSYIHIRLNRDQQSCKNIIFDTELIRKELNCREKETQQNTQFCQKMPSVLQSLDMESIKQSLSFIYFAKKPLLTAHTKWKLSYQIMLLIRFNVIGPGDLDDFLRLVEINKSRLDQILEYLSRRSSGYSNKTSGINRFKTNTYQKLKKKIAEYLNQNNQKKGLQVQHQRNVKQSCLIYKVSLSPSGILPNPISHETKCRLIRHYQDRTQFFLKVTLMDDSGQSMKNQRYIYNKIMRKLLDQINLLGKTYAPLGWSGSQLKASSLWYVSQIYQDQYGLKKMTQQSILNFLGDFSKIPIPAKKAARIGQAFSSSYCFDSSTIIELTVQDDTSPKNYKFTDGIGMISMDLFDKIRKEIKIQMDCCLQIRYKGAKGVLLINELLQNNTIIFRKSMVKYDCNDPAAKKYLDILSWDKYLPGYLNRQIILLLRSLNISDQIFLQFQKTYINQLNKLNFNENRNLLRIFNDIDQSQDSFLLTITNLDSHYDLSGDLFFHQILQNVKDNKFAQLKKKSRILIQKSARLIGVIDDYSILKEDQLYCCIKKSRKTEDKKEIIKGHVIITRNPSLSPADVRKCRCLSQQQIGRRMTEFGYSQNYFSKFANCIVFPKNGLIPLTAQISGSDLDGDIFFICWDEKFIIKQPQVCETIDNPDKKQAVYFGRAGYTQMLDFFVKFANDEKLGRINNIHTIIADKSQFLANDKKCKQLAAIHGKAVDYAKSGQAPEQIPRYLTVRQYPDFMEKWKKPTYKSSSILGKLYRQCKQQIKKRKQNQTKKKLKFQKDLIKNIQFQGIKQSKIRQVIKQLRIFQEEVTQLVFNSNLLSEFELYTGSNTENDDLKNQFGRKRLADWLKQIRDQHQRLFFGKYHQVYELYKRLKSNELKTKNLFLKDQKQIIEKAVLCYVISYFCYCAKQNNATLEEIPKDMRQFCKKVIKAQQHYGYEGKYLGFIWVVIPKIIININFTAKS